MVAPLAAGIPPQTAGSAARGPAVAGVPHSATPSWDLPVAPPASSIFQERRKTATEENTRRNEECPLAREIRYLQGRADEFHALAGTLQLAQFLYFFLERPFHLFPVIDEAGGATGEPTRGRRSEELLRRRALEPRSRPSAAGMPAASGATMAARRRRSAGAEHGRWERARHRRSPHSAAPDGISQSGARHELKPLRRNGS